MAKDEKIDDNNIVNRVSETPKVSRLPEKRKLSPLPAAPPNKVLVVSKTTSLDHNFWTVENEQTSPRDVDQVPPATTHNENVALISSTINEISGQYFFFSLTILNLLKIQLNKLYKDICF